MEYYKCYQFTSLSQKDFADKFYADFGTKKAAKSWFVENKDKIAAEIEGKRKDKRCKQLEIRLAVEKNRKYLPGMRNTASLARDLETSRKVKIGKLITDNYSVRYGGGIKIFENPTQESEITVKLHVETEWIRYTKSVVYPKDTKTLHVTVRNLKYAANNAVIVGGLLTIKTASGRVEWLVKDGHHFNVKSGWLVNNDHHIISQESETLEQATARFNLEETRRKEAAKKARELKKHRKSCRLEEIFVTISDSIAAGNCQSGTLNFYEKICEKIGKVGALRADLLLELAQEDNLEKFAQKAIEAARYAHN